MDRRRFIALIGGALATARARAQQPGRKVRLGFLSTSLEVFGSSFWNPFGAAMAVRGWSEGREYTIEARESRADPVRGLAMAKELVALKVDVILAIATSSAVAARSASRDVPVVTWCGYPVEAGLATSLARPGGNVTGIANYAGVEIWGKYIEFLRELRPGMRRLGVLWDYAPPAFPDAHVATSNLEKDALRQGVSSRIWIVRREQDLDDALAEIDRGAVEALIMTSGGGVHVQPKLADRIADVVTRRRLPAIVDVANPFVFERARCVLAYSPDGPEILGRLAHFIDRILRGAKPGALPFELPSKFNLVVNVNAAKALELKIPPSLLLRADRVIE